MPFARCARCARRGRLETAVCVGIRSPEGPAAIVTEADVVADGTEGFVELLERLAA